ncbi:TMEM175 family protein [Kitasatospora sp. NPDC088783]|uniref:TMEM175 family protein n=1 Tax=Kitasatospora sp. NPDC088783 TaxID=3364077 RepID=UPI003815E055
MRAGTRFTRSDTARAEAFSDGVFAIAVTILVLDLSDPPHRSGGLAHALAQQWPAYVGYAASFSYVAVIWLNHHQAFVRVRSLDRGLQAANLLVLFTTAALPFPTGVLSRALQEDFDGADARTAVALYAGVAAAMCLSWVVLYHCLRRRPELLATGVEPSYLRHGSLRSWIGVGLYAAAGVLGAALAPLVALGVFLLVPAFYLLTSEGFGPARTGAGAGGGAGGGAGEHG